MKRLAQSVVAVAFGVLIVTASVIGGVMVTNSNVHTVEDASDSIVQRGEGQVAAGAAILGVAAGVYVYDKYISDAPTGDELAQTDADETRASIYDSAAILDQNNEQLNTTYGNYLEDTKSIALMEGKAAFIRALENGSTETVARSKAISAVEDYYAVKQQNLIATWNTTVITARSLNQTAANTSNVAESFVSASHSGGASADGFGGYTNLTRTETLVNGTTQTVLAVEVDNNYDGQEHTTPVTFVNYQMNGDHGTLSSLYVEGTTNLNRLHFADLGEMNSKWGEIQSQTSEASNSVTELLNQTYDLYQSGEINGTDIVDPYLGAREYSPENSTAFQDWSLRTLSAMGVNPPENLSNIGRMEVVSGSNTYEGILMSDGTPDGGFTVGQTYNTGNLTGLQFVALNDGNQVELSGEFTLAAAETADGAAIADNESVTYNNITYETANTTEYQDLQQQLDDLQAEIEAKQQQQRNAGGGGLLPDFGFGGMSAPVGLIAAGAVVFLLGRN